MNVCFIEGSPEKWSVLKRKDAEVKSNWVWWNALKTFSVYFLHVSFAITNTYRSLVHISRIFDVEQIKIFESVWRRFGGKNVCQTSGEGEIWLKSMVKRTEACLKLSCGASEIGRMNYISAVYDSLMYVFSNL